ncbi:MAG: CHAD domain-containing protein [Chloroflexota bacterium]|nr:CHAD domain-containing protein [Chloroflexota bacterium]
MSEELELKFLVEDLAAAQAWLSERLGAQPDAWRNLEITDRYFDTADGALGAAGYGARLRRIGRQTVITLKSDLEVRGGLHRRDELEAPARRALDVAKWPESEARTRVIEVAGARRLIERFRVEQERREVEAHVGDAVVVVSIDDCVVLAGGRAAGSLKQLEVELHSGSEAALQALGDEIAAAGIGVPEARSKMVIAAELANAAQRVLPSDTMADAGRILLRRQLLRMIERENVARTGDPQAIKQMRVATRRMRTAWRVFGSAFKKGARRRYVAELRRVADALGEVRDLDVLRNALPPQDVLAPLAETWRERRAQAHARLVALIDDLAYAKFVGDYLIFTADAGAALAQVDVPETLAAAAPARIAAGADEMRAAADTALAGGDEIAWHALRRGARRLRYTVESLREGIGEATAADAIARLVRVQDALGAMNDAAVAAHEVEAWLAVNPTAPPETTSAATTFAGAQHAEIVRLRQSFAAVWQGAANLFTER